MIYKTIKPAILLIVGFWLIACGGNASSLDEKLIRFESPKGHFRCYFPKPPVSDSSILNTKTGQLIMYQSACVDSTIAYMVSWVDYPVAFLNTHSSELILNENSNALDQNCKFAPFSSKYADRLLVGQCNGLYVAHYAFFEKNRMYQLMLSSSQTLSQDSIVKFVDNFEVFPVL